MAWHWTLLAILTSYAAALAYRFALRWSRWRRSIAWLLASVTAGLAPCLVPRSAPTYRFIAALVTVAMLVKLYDLFRQPSLALNLPLRAYSLYLINGFWLVIRKAPPAISADWDRKRLGMTLPAVILTVGLCVALFSADCSRLPFAIEHSVKVAVLVLTIIPLTNSAAGLWRLCGGAALDPMSNPAAARTPADFWRRWNRPAQQFFQEYASRPWGGLRHPVRGVLGAFAASGLVHEYVFGIASGQVQGVQFLFFALQGLATVATIRMRPYGWMIVPCVGMTILLNLVLAVLFFKSVNSVLPFYSSRVY